jgi:hypothetical protein
LALLNEIAFAVDMGLRWRASISPTLVDGSAVVASTP